jgi:hypothetical protein
VAMSVPQCPMPMFVTPGVCQFGTFAEAP